MPCPALRCHAPTLLEVVGLAHVHADQGHELQLGQPLPSGGRQGQEVPQVGDLRVDQVPPQLARALGGLAGVEAATRQEGSSALEYSLFVSHNVLVQPLWYLFPENTGQNMKR